MDKSTLKKNLFDRWWRLNNLYFIMNDKGAKIPFKANKIQHLFYQHFWWLNVILKSRQHGITTFLCIFFLDACLFNSNVRAGIIAHRLQDAKKIFRDKVKFAYDNLPESIKKHRTLLRDDAMELLFSNNSGIYVGTSMRSGTLQYLHVSEFGYICAHHPQKAVEIKTGALETVHEGGMIFVESTAEGVQNEFHNMCKKAQSLRDTKQELTRMDYRFHFFPWFMKEENQLHADIEIDWKSQIYFGEIESQTGQVIEQPYRAWYVKKMQTLGRDMKREHPSTPQEAFEASVEGAYYGEVLSWMRLNERIGDVPYNPGYEVHCVCDPGYTTSWWFFQVLDTGYTNIIRYYEDQGRDMEYYSKMLKQLSDEHGYNYGKKYAPIDVDNNQYKLVSGDGLLQIARKAGLNFTVLPYEKSVDLGIERTRLFLKSCRIDSVGCELGIERIQAYHQKVNTRMTTETNTVYGIGPEKDGNDHAADALRYLSIAAKFAADGEGALTLPRRAS